MMTMTRITAKALVLFLTLCPVALATEELTEARFEELTKSGKNGMIKFFQPWCGHCTRMKPDWDKLSEEAHSSVFIADVNCSNEDKLCQDNGVNGYPTIKVFKDGKVEDYHGGRGFEELADYVEANLAALCDIKSVESTCSSKAPAYLEKWKAKDPADIQKENSRLLGMVGKPMAKELKGWLRERLAILAQLAPAAATEEL